MNLDQIKAMDTRQKVLLGAFALILVFLIYEVYGLLAGSGGAVTVPKATQSKFATLPTAKQSSISNQFKAKTADTPSSAGNIENLTTEPTQVTWKISPELKTILENNKQMQVQYMKLVAQYQYGQMQRMIAEQTAAIAQAKFNLAKTVAQTMKITGGSGFHSSAVLTQTQSTIATARSLQAYTVKMISYQRGQWSALLESNGAYIPVIVGTTLSNGATVRSISKRGVYIQKGQVTQRLSIPTLMPDNTTFAMTEKTTSKKLTKAAIHKAPSKSAVTQPIILKKPIQPKTQTGQSVSLQQLLKPTVTKTKTTAPVSIQPAIQKHSVQSTTPQKTQSLYPTVQPSVSKN